jgi:uncharacterized protein (TIGR03435 family)
MTRQFANRLLAAAVGMAVIGCLQTRAQSPAPASAPASAFEVVSIKPNHEASNKVMVRVTPGGRFEAQNITVRFLLQDAFGVKDSQLVGAPGWVDSEHYNIEAKGEDSAGGDEPKGGQSRLDRDKQQAQFRLMLQAMLADRFKLVLHHETKELSEYALVAAKSGPKLKETTAPAFDPATAGPLPQPGSNAPMPKGSIRMAGRGDLTVTGVDLERFADVLSRQLGQIVVDKTGLKGEYDFTLKWTPEEGQGQMFRGAGDPAKDGVPPPEAGPSIFTALQEQLGLKLESQKGPVDVLVIDHLEKPSEN